VQKILRRLRRECGRRDGIEAGSGYRAKRMPNAIRIPRAIEVFAAIEAGFALSRFTHGDWLTGMIFALAALSLAALSLRRRKPTGRRY